MAGPSSDAQAWTTQPGFDGGAQPSVVLFNGTQFLAYDGTTAFASTDGQSWTSSALPDQVRVDAAAFYDGHYFGVGSVAGTSALLLSSDGLTWTMAQATTATETSSTSPDRAWESDGSSRSRAREEVPRALATAIGPAWESERDSRRRGLPSSSFWRVGPARACP